MSLRKQIIFQIQKQQKKKVIKKAMFRKKKTNNKKNKQSNFAKLSIFQPNKYKLKRSCPLSLNGAPVIDYKNISLLKKYISDNGKIISSKITSVTYSKQKKLTREIKKAKILGLI